MNLLHSNQPNLLNSFKQLFTILLLLVYEIVRQVKFLIQFYYSINITYSKSLRLNEKANIKKLYNPTLISFCFVSFLLYA